MPVKEQTIGPSGCVSNAKQLKSKNANWENSTNAKWQLLNKFNNNFLSWCVIKNGKMSKMQNDSLSTNPLIWGCPLKIRFHWREHFEWPSLVQNSIYLKRPFQILGNQVSYLGKAPMGFHIRSIFLAKRNSIGVSQNAPFRSWKISFSFFENNGKPRKPKSPPKMRKYTT